MLNISKLALISISVFLSSTLSSCREEICLCEKRGKREYKKVAVKYKKNKNGGYKKKSYKKLGTRSQ